MLIEADYDKFYKERKKRLEDEKLNVESMNKAQPALLKVSKILEAFVIKMNFTFKKLFLSLSDERLKVTVW